MSEQREVPVPSEVDKLRQLTEFVPQSNQYLYQFGTFLAERITPRKQITPQNFVGAAELAIYDLQKGIDGFTGQPIRSELVGLPPQLYSLLRLNVTIIAKAVYSEDFAKQVEEIYQKLEERRRTQENKT